MKLRVVIVIVAVFLGLAAAYIAGSYVKRVEERVAAGSKPVAVLMAARSVPVGMRLDEARTRTLVKTKKIPEKYVPQGALTPSTDLGKQVLSVALNPGEIVTSNKLKAPKSAGLSFVVPPGMVAVSVSLREEQWVGTLPKVGDQVNVIGSVEKDGARVTKTILENVKIIAISVGLDEGKGQNDGSGSKAGGAQETKKETNVTIATDQAGAEVVVDWKESGSVWLALVSRKSGTEEATGSSTSNEGFGLGTGELGTEDSSGGGGR